MTIIQLRQYRKLKGKMLLLETEKDELILKSKAVDSMGAKSNKFSDVVGNTVLEREKIENDIKSLKGKLNVVEEYIKGCDEHIGTMLRLHYIDGKTWTAIAFIQGGGNTEDSVKKQCHRYVQKNP